MKAEVAAWQLDIFGEASPVLVVPPKPEPLPDPQYWSPAVREALVDALISLALDSRHGETLPESLMDCASLINARLRNVRVDRSAYFTALGWIMNYWPTAIPYEFVCRVGGVDPETLQEVILERPLLKRDLEELRDACFGTLL
ncbi:hypothetical protein [Paraburkholderia sp. CNPSo 3281]|uniref:hypothetical protein n=1 Tax=Paraburkholderia sp. CNPSo 3281 TaxID=2940933 RepID=UPI0020B805B0|nr:hypothetical protein [Paraburkholderia sp. CNPSo 3281]MCP3718503.1 hypothetical protein [Paraburkholderia sp. CNPSo 3281]